LFSDCTLTTQLSEQHLLQSLCLHLTSGIGLTPAPHDTETARQTTPGALSYTLDFVRTRYEFILVDLPPGLNDANLELIRHCDQVNVVTVAEVSALRNVVRQTDYLTRKHITAERIKVVLNRHQNRALITEAQNGKYIR